MVISYPQPTVLRSSAPRSLSSEPVVMDEPKPAPVQILGRVAFWTHRGEPALAILDTYGVWRCPHLPVLDRVLNTLFRPDEAISLNDPAFGRAELERAASWIKGEVQELGSWG